jgi:hypothetical protein
MIGIIRVGICSLLLLLSLQASSQGNPVLQLDGTDGGLVLNRLTNLQRNAIVNPISGLIIYNVDTGCLNYYSIGKWYASCGIEIETCNGNGDCPSGKVCDNGLCIDDPDSIPCETDEQCPEGLICSNGFCVQP